MNNITPNEFLEKMQAIEKENVNDSKICYKRAVALMTDLLYALGYKEGIVLFDQLKKVKKKPELKKGSSGTRFSRRIDTSTRR